MAEVTHPRHDHGDAMFVGSGDHFIVPHGTSRLDDRGCTGLNGGKQTVGKREERVGSDHAALGERFCKTGGFCRVFSLAGCDAG